MKAVKNIVFDLGGVLIDIDYQRPLEAFTRLGYSRFEELYSQHLAGPLFIELEKGLVSPDEFLEKLVQMGPDGVSKEKVLDAWNSILLEFRLSSLHLLDKLRQHYRIFLLSNTNALHQEAFNMIFSRQIQRGCLDDFFEKAYYSHIIGERKPEASAYTYVLESAGINADETLFIDDTIANISAAENIGFQTYLLPKGELIEQLSGKLWVI